MLSNNENFPEFSLPNFKLRNIGERDVAAVYAGLSNPDVIKHYGVSYSSLEETAHQMDWYRQIQEKQQGVWWGIARYSDDVLIGACGFNDWDHGNRKISLGYWLMPEYWGQGLLQQCLPTILRHAFSTMRVHRIHAEVEPENIASWRLLERLGFQPEGTLRDVELKGESFLSLHQYSLLSTDERAVSMLGCKEARMFLARPGDAQMLSELAKASKAHWGYPSDWLAAWEKSLSPEPNALTGHYYILKDDEDSPLGFCGLELHDRCLHLEHCWVHPNEIGRGHGRRLVEHALNVARAVGVDKLRVESDPHAMQFYVRMGAHHIGDIDRPIAGLQRLLPILEWRL